LVVTNILAYHHAKFIEAVNRFIVAESPPLR